ncbi:MAG: AAA family ATPase [Merdibacter sp.]
MKKNIITISRQFGSGGRSIGKMLSERLGIPFYDKELIELASKESGIDEQGSRPVLSVLGASASLGSLLGGL